MIKTCMHRLPPPRIHVCHLVNTGSKKAAFLFALLRDEETPRLHCILFYLMEYSYLSRHTPLILQGFQESPQPVASLSQVAHGIGIGNAHMTFSGFSER